MAALAPMDLEIERERITDSVATLRVAGKDVDVGARSSPTPAPQRPRLIGAGHPSERIRALSLERPGS